MEKLRAMLAKGGGGGGGGGGGAKKKSQLVSMMKGNQADASAIHDELAHLSEEEKTAYLKELEEQMELMGACVVCVKLGLCLIVVFCVRSGWLSESAGCSTKAQEESVASHQS